MDKDQEDLVEEEELQDNYDNEALGKGCGSGLTGWTDSEPTFEKNMDTQNVTLKKSTDPDPNLIKYLMINVS